MTFPVLSISVAKAVSSGPYLPDAGLAAEASESSATAERLQGEVVKQQEKRQQMVEEVQKMNQYQVRPCSLTRLVARRCA